MIPKEQYAQLETENARLRSALEKISYLAPDKEPPHLLGTNTAVREAYKLGYEWAQWEDAKIANDALVAQQLSDAGQA